MNSLTRVFSNLPKLPISYQQVRFSRRSFKFRTSYGRVPMLTDEEYIEAKESNQLEDLQYEKVMKGGKRQLAERLLDETLYEIKTIQYRKMKKREAKAEKAGDKFEIPIDDEDGETIEINPVSIFKIGRANAEPVVITRKIKRGGATYQVPFPISKNDSEWIATKWLINAVLDRPKPRKKNFPEVMAQELLDAYYNRGKVIKKRDDVHRLADANKAYSHYRWG